MITLFDLLLFFVVAYAYFVKMNNEGMLHDISKELWDFIFHMILYIIAFIILPITCLLIMGFLFLMFSRTLLNS